MRNTLLFLIILIAIAAVFYARLRKREIPIQSSNLAQEAPSRSSGNEEEIAIAGSAQGPRNSLPPSSKAEAEPSRFPYRIAFKRSQIHIAKPASGTELQVFYELDSKPVFHGFSDSQGVSRFDLPHRDGKYRLKANWHGFEQVWEHTAEAMVASGKEAVHFEGEGTLRVEVRGWDGSDTLFAVIGLRPYRGLGDQVRSPRLLSYSMKPGVYTGEFQAPCGPGYHLAILNSQYQPMAQRQMDHDLMLGEQHEFIVSLNPDSLHGVQLVFHAQDSLRQSLGSSRFAVQLLTWLEAPPQPNIMTSFRMALDRPHKVLLPPHRPFRMMGYVPGFAPVLIHSGQLEDGTIHVPLEAEGRLRIPLCPSFRKLLGSLRRRGRIYFHDFPQSMVFRSTEKEDQWLEISGLGPAVSGIRFGDSYLPIQILSGQTVTLQDWPPPETLALKETKVVVQLVDFNSTSLHATAWHQGRCLFSRYQFGQASRPSSRFHLSFAAPDGPFELKFTAPDQNLKLRTGEMVAAEGDRSFRVQVYAQSP
ncbi:MAG: hypothetical protein DWQ01_20985 [Planctomycetota bacterium]|nr:MAG: hypothetical protein DWQ01_20985 [Planctomycetota bacterium]